MHHPQAPVPEQSDLDPELAGAGPGQSRPARYDRRGPQPATVSLVVPTYNEVENLPVLIDRLGQVLADLDYEIIVVDDNSPDGTWQVAEELAAADRRIRVLRRVGRRGLSSAVLEGMGVAEGRVLAVIDADLQHDEAALPEILSAVLDGDADICVGSREADGGSYGQFGPVRRAISWTGATFARRLLGVGVSDPMSGYFALSRDRFDDVVGSVNPRGFKILLEFLARGPRPRVAEIGYGFRTRTRGETKLTGSVVLAYLLAIMELALARVAAPGVTTYAAIAVTALSARLSLTATFLILGFGETAGLAAIELAILAELLLHDRITFGSLARGGRRVGPIVRFHLVAGYGYVAQLGVGVLIERHLPATSGMAGGIAVLAVATATVVASVIASYFLNRTLTWPGASLVLFSDQARRPTTASTSSEISATARR